MKDIIDIAVIFKVQTSRLGKIEYIPVRVELGTYDESTKYFLDTNGTCYYHLIDDPENYGFCYRTDIMKYANKYPNIPTFLLKKLILREIKKSNYEGILDADTDTPIILVTKKKKDDNSKIIIALDQDIVSYYQENYPSFLFQLASNIAKDETKIKNPVLANIDNKPKELEEPLKIDIPSMYKEITSRVIDQDEPIKRILTAIWKQYNNFSENKSRNILIYGNSGVGKTEIFRILSKKIDVPCVITSATEYSATGYVGKDVTEMLTNLLERANGDIEKAQRGILIIDEMDKLSATSSNSSVNQRDVQEALLKIIEDGTYVITWHNTEYEFNTSKLLVVGMGSWSRVELEGKKTVGFGSVQEKKQYRDLTREDFIQNGMIPELIGRFPVIVPMNELTYESFLKILKNENSVLSNNINFFEKNGVKLTVDETVLSEIAKIASKQKFGARSLDEIVDKTLSIASFEIANNPEIYEELIIEAETIHNNTKYKLIKKKQIENK